MPSIPERLKKLSPYLLIAIPLLLLIPGMGGFPFPSEESIYSDLAISHFPNAVFLRQSLLAGEFPFWADTILSGYPFAANPLSSVWYLPHYFALLFPLPLGLNLAVVLHLFLGGVGVLRYLRHQGVSTQGAIAGALAFVSMPKIFAHFGAGHVTLLYAVSWTPWLMLALESKRDTPLKQPALVLALIFLADPRWAAYAGLLWLGWVFACSHENSIKRTKKFVFQLLLTLGMSGSLLFPLLAYTRLSTRGHMTPQDVLSFSLSPAGLLGIFFPNFGGSQETITYFGIFTAILVLIALLTPTRHKVKFWFWVAALSLLYALGENIPGMGYIARLPGLSLLRVPTRALFLTGFSFAIISGYAIDAVSRSLDASAKKRIRLTLMGLLTFSTAIALAVILSSGEFSLEFVWGAAALLLGWGILELWFSRRIKFNTFISLFLLFALLDWGMIDQSLFAYQPRDSVVAQGAEAAEWLSNQPGYFRVYSPSYSIPQQTAILYDLHLADGIDPLQLENYAEFMESATGIPRQGYTVTMPPFIDVSEEGDISQANKAFTPSINKLQRLQVRYIAAEFDLDIVAPLVAQFDETRIYELPPSTEAQEPFNSLRVLGGRTVFYWGFGTFILGIIGLFWSAHKERAA